MSMLDVHAVALEAAGGPFHEFLLSYKAARPVVYGFVEGKEDPSFYRGFIEQALPVGWSVRLIRSGNRDAVLTNLKDMPWERFPRSRICFFIDRDLSQFIDAEQVAAENLYVTDNYSIENDVVNRDVFERVLEEVLGVTDLSEAERDAVANLFETNFSAFCEAMVPVMAQILIWRREKVNAPLDNIKVTRFFEYSDAIVSVRAEFSTEPARIAYASGAVKQEQSKQEELQESEKRFRAGQGATRFIRGKYLLHFFIDFAHALHAAIPKFCRRHKAPPKIRVTMGAGNAMIIIAPRAKAPESLREFVKKNYGAYAASS